MKRLRPAAQLQAKRSGAFDGCRQFGVGGAKRLTRLCGVILKCHIGKFLCWIVLSALRIRKYSLCNSLHCCSTMPNLMGNNRREPAMNRIDPAERTLRRAARRAEQARLLKLGRAMQRRAPLDAVKVLGKEDDATIAKVLSGLDPVFAFQLFNWLPEERRTAILPAMPADLGEQWHRNQQWPEDSVGRLMESPTAVFPANASVTDAVKVIRRLARTRMFTYAYVVDSEQRLLGVVVMRDLLLAKREQL